MKNGQRKMRTFAKSTPETLITFHIGRGGHFHNPGYKSYCDQDTTIDSYTDGLFTTYEQQDDIDKLIGDRPNLRKLFEKAIYDDWDAIERIEFYTGLSFGDKIYVDWNGTPVGLDVDNDGTGSIIIDGSYDTTIVCRLKDCNDDELELILRSNNYVSEDVRDYCREQLGIEDENE